MATLIGRVLSPWRRPELSVMEAPAKAAFGIGVSELTWSPHLSTLQKTPQKMAEQAMALYHVNPWVHRAEAVVSGKGAIVDWHLEDANEEEIDDKSDPKYLAIRDLLEKPQAGLPMANWQTSIPTRSWLWTLTLRHMGLCGSAFWYLDQAEALAGTPLSILYLRPDKMFATTDKAGNLLGWTFGAAFGEEGAIPLERKNVLPFYLDPPDSGHFGIGLVESAWTKAGIGPLADRHVSSVLASGGRLAGMLIQKEGASVDSDQWQQFISDFRGIVEDPNAAKRLQILRVPADYVKTAATLAELDIASLANLARDDVLTLWGVPGSQVGVKAPEGLNSGSTKGFDEAILWQGAIHTRLQSMYETIQYGLLDRYKALGTVVELVITEPEFDDDTPLYQRATQAANLPLTNDERRSIVGFEPLDTAIYGPWGQVVTLPNNIAEVAGPGVAEKLAADAAAQAQQAQAQIAALNAPASTTPTTTSSVAPASQSATAATTAIGKATLGSLRQRTDRLEVPRIKASVMSMLAEQRDSVVRRIRNLGLEHLRRKPGDKRSFWHDDAQDSAFMEALTPHVEKIARAVSVGVERKLRPAKADPFAERVAVRVLTRGAGRIKGINQTTRDAVSEAITASLDGASSISDVIAAVEALDIFSELRAETIARTESMFAYNDAALSSYAEFGVTEVQAIDGDGDEECAARDGQTFSLEEAGAIEDHPNGTLDWVPLLPDEPVAGKAQTDILVDLAQSMKATLELLAMREPVHQPNITVNVPPQPPANVTVNPPAVNVTVEGRGAMKFVRDADGRPAGMEPA